MGRFRPWIGNLCNGNGLNVLYVDTGNVAPTAEFRRIVQTAAVRGNFALNEQALRKQARG